MIECSKNSQLLFILKTVRSPENTPLIMSLIFLNTAISDNFSLKVKYTTVVNTGIRIIIDQKTNENPVKELNFSSKGLNILVFIKFPKKSNLPTKSVINNIKSISKSTARSMMTVPRSLSAGIFSTLASVPHLVISPILGNAKFARYPTINE